MDGTFFLLPLLLSVLAVAEAAAAPPSFRGGCTDQLIWFSPCLSYVSSSPNNLTETVSTKCCDAFSSSFAPNSLCFCYLLRDPHILGFPLNTTRLLSLSSLCLSPPPNTSSFNFLCAASPALPPLSSAETLGIRSPPVTAAGTGSGSGSRGGAGAEEGRMVPRNGRGAGTTFYFPSLSGSTSTIIGGYGNNKTLLLSQSLAVFFVTLPLLKWPRHPLVLDFSAE